MRLKAPADGPRPSAQDGAASSVKGLIRELSSIRAEMLRREAGAEAALLGLHEAYRESAKNLIHYMTLRRHELREAQHRLAELGLSSLGGAASHVMQNLEAVLRALRCMEGSGGTVAHTPGDRIGPSEGHRLLVAHARALLGPEPRRRRVRIMVTMPSKAADDYDLVRDLLAQGMDCMRVNCAHDGPREWSRMIENLKRARQETRRRCRVLMDLPGPKIRTGPVELGLAAERRAGSVSELPPEEPSIRVRVSERLILRFDRRPGSPAEYDREGRVARPASISVTMPEAFAHVREGEAVWFDDGKIGGRVVKVSEEEVEVEITQAGPEGEKLKSDKGINLPESRLDLPHLTEGDIEVLPFVARNADLVGYSFVRSAAGVRALQKRLAALGGEGVGVVLKIETRRAFLELPNIILAAMRGPSVGVMIARGDMAVECGYERLAELQEEVLWACEAAHVPVIWATQVLESLAKKGRPSRSEITDAAQGARAECVMLNKGDYILDAVSALDDILRRMQSHQRKNRPMLRPLKLKDEFASG